MRCVLCDSFSHVHVSLKNGGQCKVSIVTVICTDEKQIMAANCVHEGMMCFAMLGGDGDE